MDTKEMLQSKNFQRTLYGIVILAGVLIIFQAGVIVGYQKASFSYGRADNYDKAFGSRKGMPKVMFFNDFSDAHGAAGKIVKVNLPTILIEDSDGTEKIILVTGTTLIRQMRDIASTTALQEGEFIIVVGSPNNKSQVVASLIRLLPPPFESKVEAPSPKR